MKTILKKEDMKAVAERLKANGMIAQKRPLSPAEVERITNEKRNEVQRKGRA